MIRFWMGAGCAVLLAGCGGRAFHVATPQLAPPQAPAALPPHPISDGNAPSVPDGNADVWAAVVAGRAFTDCDYAAGIDKWARRIAGSPEQFSAELERVAPWVDWVWREAHALGMPAEVALLPLVESGYRPVIGGFGAPGGWWQLMPGTAKVLGLRVDRGHDERMDPLAATLAALGMLRQLGDRYQDNWLLALVAYNVGPLYVDRWVAKSGQPMASIQRVEQLPAPRVTIDHLHRMMAFGCLLAQPQRYRLQLPELASRDQVARVMLKQAVPSAAVPAALGERGAEWRKQNPQLMRLRALDAGRALLAPEDLHARLRALGSLTPFERQSVRHAEATTAAVATPGRPQSASSSRLPQFHVVHGGDSLWLVARRYDLRIKDLLALNPRLTRKSVLRLNQKLRLR